MVEEYTPKTEKLAVELTELVGGIRPWRRRDDNLSPPSTSTMRMNYYLQCPQSSHTFRISPHFNFFSILLQDIFPGLQVLKDGEWITVEPNPHTLVVNVSDTFQAWGSVRIRSVTHRALMNTIEPRLTGGALLRSPS